MAVYKNRSKINGLGQISFYLKNLDFSAAFPLDLQILISDQFRPLRLRRDVTIRLSMGGWLQGKAAETKQNLKLAIKIPETTEE